MGISYFVMCAVVIGIIYYSFIKINLICGRIKYRKDLKNFDFNALNIRDIPIPLNPKAGRNVRNKLAPIDIVERGTTLNEH